jgi:hypothetical protein
MSYNKKIEWILRVGIAGEFLGHGLLAIGGKQDWINWITQLTSVSPSTATTLLLVIGVVDVLLALLILVKPVRPILLWMAFWGLWTAFVRPLANHFTYASWLDFVERFANWAAPLALYYYYKINSNDDIR